MGKKMSVITLLCVVFGLAVEIHGIPPPIPGQAKLAHSRPARGAETVFNELCVYQDQTITWDTTDPTCITVKATQSVSELGLITAAVVTARMFEQIRTKVFSKIAQYHTVMVFAADEDLTVIAEFAHLACEGSCTDGCADVCTVDGRMYKDLVGFSDPAWTGITAIRVDNVLCTETDPYEGKVNVLVHELAHTLYFYLSDKKREKVLQLYKYRKALDDESSVDPENYAMTDEYEYFAEAVTAWYFSSKYHDASGGFTLCGSRECYNEKENRLNICKIHADLYTLLLNVCSSREDYRPSRLSTCVNDDFSDITFN